MRLFTRNNMDGVVSAALILRREPAIHDIAFVHPKDVQDRNISFTPGDALTNLPFHPGAALWFDHHTSGQASLPEGVRGMVKNAPSASRVVHDFYHYEDDPEYARIHDMLHYTDRLDSAMMTFAEVLEPDGWSLLGFMLDPATGLDLDLNLYKRITWSIRDGLSIRDILALDQIRAAAYRYRAEEESSKIMLMASAHAHGNVIVHDLRDDDTPLVVNRFAVYALFPRANVSVRVTPHRHDASTLTTSAITAPGSGGKLDARSSVPVAGGSSKRDTGTAGPETPGGGSRFDTGTFLGSKHDFGTVGLMTGDMTISAGKSIFRRTLKLHIGNLMATFGGGGLDGAGSCRVPRNQLDQTLETLMGRLRE